MHLYVENTTCQYKQIGDVSPIKNKNSTSKYSQGQNSMEELIESNIEYCNTFDLKITEYDKTRPILYWLPKTHKTPIYTRFIVISKICITKPLSDVISKWLSRVISKFSKWLFTKLKVFFIEKLCFTHALRSFGL